MKVRIVKQGEANGHFWTLITTEDEAGFLKSCIVSSTKALTGDKSGFVTIPPAVAQGARWSY